MFVRLDNEVINLNQCIDFSIDGILGKKKVGICFRYNNERELNWVFKNQKVAEHVFDKICLGIQKGIRVVYLNDYLVEDENDET